MGGPLLLARVPLTGQTVVGAEQGQGTMIYHMRFGSRGGPQARFNYL